MEHRSESSRNIRERFGLRYLTGTEGKRSAPVTAREAKAVQDKGIDAATIVVGGRILFAMKALPDHTVDVYDLVDQTSLDIEVVLPMAERLQKMGLIRYVKRDKRGNHKIQLTEEGVVSLK